MTSNNNPAQASAAQSVQVLSPQLLAAALAQVGDAIVIVDEDYRIVYLNDAAANQYDVDPAVIVGSPLSELHHYEWLHPLDEAAAAAALEQYGLWRGRNYHVLPTGLKLLVESTVTALNNGDRRYLLAVIRDITSEQRTATILRESEEWRRLALEGAQLGAWAVNLLSGEWAWDARCRQIMGAAPDEPAGLERGLALIHPDDRPRVLAAMQSLVRGESDGLFADELRVVWPDGSARWLAARGCVFYEESADSRTPVRLAGIVLDITERKQYEENLLRAQRRIAFAEQAARSFLYDWNLETNEVERSAGILRVLGYHPEELAADPTIWNELIHPDDFARLSEFQPQRVAAGEQYSIEYRVRHRDGHYVDVWDQGVVERNAEGKSIRVVGITADISERKRIEQELVATQERLRLALEKAPLSFGQNDQELRYTWMYNQHPDFQAVDFLGKRDNELAQNPETLRFMEVKQQVLATGKGQRREFTFPLSDGEHTYDITIEPLHDAAGAVIGTTSAALDISERKQYEAALQELNETLEQRVAERTAELERTIRDLDRFAYVASHDLKSPLRGIDYLAQWVIEDSAGTLSPVAQRHLERLRGRVRRLEALLDDLLLYSRAGRKRYSPEMVDAAALVAGIVELLNPPPGFQIVVESPLPTLRCERPPFETVMRNLIENAVKHHDRHAHGHVSVTAQQQPGLVEFCVRDNGPGIEPQYHDRIFEVFQTLRPRDELEGSGMGLAIVKKIVEAAGGRIWLESVPGQGAAFHFTWPLNAPASG